MHIKDLKAIREYLENLKNKLKIDKNSLDTLIIASQIRSTMGYPPLPDTLWQEALEIIIEKAKKSK